MSRKILFLAVGVFVLVCIVVGLGVFVLLPKIHAADVTPTATPTPVVSVSPTVKPVGPLVQALKQYGPDIKNQIAQDLHLTPDQLKMQLKGGKALSDVATAQNVSTDQLNTLIHDAVENGLKPAVDSGSIKQKQVDSLVKKYQTNQKAVEHFLGAGTKAA